VGSGWLRRQGRRGGDVRTDDVCPRDLETLIDHASVCAGMNQKYINVHIFSICIF